MKALLTAFFLAAAWAQPALAQPQDAIEPLVDYVRSESWLCLPGRADACAVDLSSMTVNARGGASLREFRPAREPKADCFYVYPTVSRDPGQTSDMTPGLEERQMVAAQFARFAAACRTYAPIYRQLTRTAIEPLLSDPDGAPPVTELLLKAPRQGGYEDVRAAFEHYMTHYNAGRPFVLIGHSQGAMHLIRLLREEIEGTPAQSQLVSAILLGANVEVPPGKTVGGTFRTLPLCRSDSQTGCIITYSSFRDTNPPSADALFGQGEDGLIAGCTNPADLRRGTGEPQSYFVTGVIPWTGDPYRPVGTPYVETPGLLTTTCVSGPSGTYLQVHVNADPKGARVDDIPGDLMLRGKADPAWGLHTVDMNISQGDLVEIVARQSRAWRPAPPRPNPAQ